MRLFIIICTLRESLAEGATLPPPSRGHAAPGGRQTSPCMKAGVLGWAGKSGLHVLPLRQVRMDRGKYLLIFTKNKTYIYIYSLYILYI